MQTFENNKKLILATFLLSLVLFPFKVQAAEPEVTIRDAGYSAKFVSQSISDPIEIEAGKTRTVVIKFKNTGEYTWNGNPSHYISAYTMEPRDRSSQFKGVNWLSSKQTAKIVGTVAPGQIGELRIDLKAPIKTGDYIEKFYLASENYSWLEDGYFYLKIKVILAVEPVAELALEKELVEGVSPVEGYSARRLILTPKIVEGVQGGDKIKVIVGFRNKGENTWENFSLRSAEEGYADVKWDGATTIESWEEDVLPGNFLRRTFYFRAPVEKGEYTAKFQLKIDDVELAEALVGISVSVSTDAPSSYGVPKFVGEEEIIVIPETSIVETNRVGVEPRIRVGLKVSNYYVQFRSYQDDYNVFDGSIKKGVLAKGSKAVLRIKDGVYSFDGSSLDFNATKYIRLEPKTDPHAVFDLLNVDRYMSWVGSADFNRYRGALEFRQGEIDEQFYAVNDLFLEDYVAGISEAHNNNNKEFIKANLVAARNYAYVHLGKYPFFDVLGSTHDQLYLGYEAELAQPNVAQAAKDVRGVMVTYGNKIVTTPYFGNSNGWTKSYSSVWGGGAKPWLVPVRAEYDAGRYKFGHGVGMSQRDARLRADDLGSTFDELLRHYYTGVVVEQVYK
ncbi:MAG: hypothetical protein HOA57_04755 [Candidatus Magasanikbacteria bacterium]|jgi:hypothetical protein|nr:hypothetical protein [Candidatus Magasanikbacteria bacterium]MBT4314874.1 hypothetical protein [Candidatus Magasanikbacteria bacterium]MBT4546739.1 hypothetical protein [Candidatus Magasanikbacteria bacterium]MBT6819652.1 hypothetical protein [Candidatus Magasanikbacteria bacterium]